MPTLTTDLLEIAYEDDGPRDGPPVLLLHGWPDSPRTWREVASRLTQAGYRTIVPALRGFAPTRFRDPDIPRTGQVVALAQDALDLLDGLGLDRAAVVGHDWGARTGYALAALAPERVSRLVAVSVGYAPGGRRRAAELRAGPAVVVPVVPDPRRRRRGGGPGPDRLRPCAVGHLEPDRLVRGVRVRRDREGVPAP